MLHLELVFLHSHGSRDNMVEEGRLSSEDLKLCHQVETFQVLGGDRLWALLLVGLGEVVRL